MMQFHVLAHRLVLFLPNVDFFYIQFGLVSYLYNSLNYIHILDIEKSLLIFQFGTKPENIRRDMSKYLTPQIRLKR